MLVSNALTNLNSRAWTQNPLIVFISDQQRFKLEHLLSQENFIGRLIYWEQSNKTVNSKTKRKTESLSLIEKVGSGESAISKQAGSRRK